MRPDLLAGVIADGPRPEHAFRVFPPCYQHRQAGLHVALLHFQHFELREIARKLLAAILVLGDAVQVTESTRTSATRSLLSTRSSSDNGGGS